MFLFSNLSVDNDNVGLSPVTVTMKNFLRQKPRADRGYKRQPSALTNNELSSILSTKENVFIKYS